MDAFWAAQQKLTGGTWTEVQEGGVSLAAVANVLQNASPGSIARCFSLKKALLDHQQTNWSPILELPSSTIMVLAKLESREHGTGYHFLVVNTALRHIMLQPDKYLTYTDDDAADEKAIRAYLKEFNIIRPLHAYELRVHSSLVEEGRVSHIFGDIIRKQMQPAGERLALDSKRKERKRQKLEKKKLKMTI